MSYSETKMGQENSYLSIVQLGKLCEGKLIDKLKIVQEIIMQVYTVEPG